MNNSKFTKVKNAKIHYIEAGKGDNSIVFLHGVPSSSYMWRNIIPVLSDKAHCIAPDLIGMGKSDKPNIQYTFLEHIQYFEDFIKSLNLRNITLVVHGLLGSAIGFNYAMQHKDNIKAIAFYEAYVRPVKNFNMLSLPIQHLLHLVIKKPAIGYKAVMENNYLINKLLPLSTLHKLTDEEINNYKQPFLSISDRKPLWQYIQDFFVAKNNQQLLNYVTEYSEKLKQSPIPKLMLYTVPGFVTTMDCVKWSQDNLPNLQTADLEEGLYLAPESNPLLFSQILLDWYENI
jgi:haloalkane dehalogenase